MSHRCDGRDPSCRACSAIARRDSLVREAMTTDDALDDIARLRIWNAVAGRLGSAPVRRFAHRGAVVAGVTLAAAAVIAIVVTRESPEQTLSVAADATLTSRIGPHTRAALVGPAELDVIGTPGDTTIVRLRTGTLLADFHGGTARSLVIDAPGLRVDVVGTLFAVDVRPDATCVSVAHGTVRVTTATVAVAVPAGEAFCTQRGRTPIEPAVRDALAHHAAITADASDSEEPRTRDRSADSISTSADRHDGSDSTSAPRDVIASGSGAPNRGPDVTSGSGAPAGAIARTSRDDMPRVGRGDVSSTADPTAGIANGRGVDSRADASASAGPSGSVDVTGARHDSSTSSTSRDPAPTNPAGSSAPVDASARASRDDAKVQPRVATDSTASRGDTPASDVSRRDAGASTVRPSDTTAARDATAPARLPAAPPMPATAEELYRFAERALAGRDDTGADRALERLVTEHASSPLVEQALYERVRIAYRQRSWAAARRSIDRIIAIPGAQLAEPAHYLACRIAVETRDGNAAACLTGFRTAYPRSPHDRDVLGLLVQLDHAAGGCTAAAARIAELARRYPRDRLTTAWQGRCE